MVVVLFTVAAGAPATWRAADTKLSELAAQAMAQVGPLEYTVEEQSGPPPDAEDTSRIMADLA